MDQITGFARCAPSFQTDLRKIAAANGLTVEAVYGMWRQYSADCQSYDQSALLSEFLGWYREQLPNLPSGYFRLG